MSKEIYKENITENSRRGMNTNKEISQCLEDKFYKQTAGFVIRWKLMPSSSIA